MKSVFRLRKSGFLVLVLAALTAAFPARGQDYSSMGISEVVSAADEMLKKGDFTGAIPALEEVVRRTKELQTEDGRKTCQNARYQLARAYIQVGNTRAALPLLEEYLKSSPIENEAGALRLLAQVYFDQQKWDKVVELCRRLLKLPHLSKDDRVIGSLLYGQALFHLGKWEECVKPLDYAADNYSDERIARLTRIMAVRALINAKKWSAVFARIPRLYRTEAKYDIALNLTLMNAGKALFDRGESKDYLNALVLYRMVLPREKLLAYAEKKLRKLKAEREKKSKRLNADVSDLDAQIAQLEESIKTLKDLPPYEEEVSFRIGQIYSEVKRYWEAFVLFDHLYRKNPNGEIGEASLLQSVLVLFQLKEDDRAEKRALAYLDSHPNGKYVRPLVLVMLRHYIQTQQGERAERMSKYLQTLPPSSDQEDKEMDASLHHLLAFGYFSAKNYKAAEQEFTTVLEKYPDSPLCGEALYFRGMSRLMQGNFKDALEDFVLYQKKYSNGEYVAQALFRQGVCLYGLGKYDEAKEVFTRFINTYPDNELVSEAYSMRGDIYAAMDSTKVPDALDRALKDYRKAIDKHATPEQAAYAAFQAAKVYKLEYRWQDIIDLMNYYMTLLDKDADVAQAVYWIGQAMIEQDRIKEAINVYLDAIQRFGNDPTKVGIDKIVRGLVTLSKQYLSDIDRRMLISDLKKILAEMEGENKDVLKLRISVATAALMGDDVLARLGEGLLKKNQDLSITTPISLSLMCDAAVRLGDTNKMIKVADYFMEHYPDSDDIWHAYRAKIYGLLAAKKYDEVLKLIDEVQGIYGIEKFMSWAQLVKADTLYRMGKYKEAEDAYNAVLGVSEWRGAPMAEAMYGMGKCRYAAKDYATAHDYFQRCYLLFQGYANGHWAAEGYLAAADCLMKLGRRQDAINTLKAMLEDSYVNTLPQAKKARELIKKYGGEE